MAKSSKPSKNSKSLSAVAAAPAFAIAASIRRCPSGGRYCQTTLCISTRVTPSGCGSASRISTQSAASP